MKKEIEVTQKEVKTVKMTTFKMHGVASQPHFVQKVVGHREEVKDGLNPIYGTFFTVFYPKLQPAQQRPCVMLHIRNGAGKVLVRFAQPEDLAEWLRYLADVVTSTEWLEKWMQLEDIADRLVNNNEIQLDNQFVDVQDFTKHIEAESKKHQKKETSDQLADYA